MVMKDDLKTPCVIINGYLLRPLPKYYQDFPIEGLLTSVLRSKVKQFPIKVLDLLSKYILTLDMVQIQKGEIFLKIFFGSEND